MSNGKPILSVEKKFQENIINYVTNVNAKSKGMLKLYVF
jgi:hypothetical protein